MVKSTSVVSDSRNHYHIRRLHAALMLVVLMLRPPMKRRSAAALPMCALRDSARVRLLPPSCGVPRT